MDGPSGLNQPRRKSRLRSRDNDYVPRQPLASFARRGRPPLVREEAPVYDPRVGPGGRAFAPTSQTASDHATSARLRVTAAQAEDEDGELPEAFRLTQGLLLAPRTRAQPAD